MVASAPAPRSAPVRPVSLRIAIIGAGYVGLVSAACFAELGHTVAVVEIDPARLDLLRRGGTPIREAGLQELIERHGLRGSRRLTFTDSHARAMVDADLVMVAVGTPSAPDGSVDLRWVEEAVRTVSTLSPDALLVMKSTVPPGTARCLQELARTHGGLGVRVASNPEFLREGQAVSDFMHPDRVVIGADESEDADLIETLYEPLRATVIRCRTEEAELAKYASNALLAARISFMNEVGAIADAVGADVTRVSSIVGADRRIGASFLAAGIGWGGSCFPKDVSGLAATARALGLRSVVLDATMQANERARERALEIVLESLAGVRFPRAGILGTAFKPGTDDVRESPALWLASALLDRGVEVQATDPWAAANAERLEPRLRIVDGVLRAAEGADVVVLATEWPDYCAPDWRTVARQMSGRTVLDARNVLDERAVNEAGLLYRALGRDVAGRAHAVRPCA